LDTAQKEVRRLKRQLDKGIEAKDLAERFLDREKELKAELDKCKQTLLAVNADLSQTKYLVKNKHDMNEKCKRQVKSMEQKCAEFDSIKARVEELEKSVMQVLQTLWLGVCVHLIVVACTGFGGGRPGPETQGPASARQARPLHGPRKLYPTRI
jgi:predicted RNase H-like nuclease (RuvC/YqgF family)